MKPETKEFLNSLKNVKQTGGGKKTNIALSILLLWTFIYVYLGDILSFSDIANKIGVEISAINTELFSTLFLLMSPASEKLFVKSKFGFKFSDCNSLIKGYEDKSWSEVGWTTYMDGVDSSSAETCSDDAKDINVMMCKFLLYIMPQIMLVFILNCPVALPNANVDLKGYLTKLYENLPGSLQNILSAVAPEDPMQMLLTSGEQTPAIDDRSVDTVSTRDTSTTVNAVVQQINVRQIIVAGPTGLNAIGADVDTRTLAESVVEMTEAADPDRSLAALRERMRARGPDDGISALTDASRGTQLTDADRRKLIQNIDQGQEAEQRSLDEGWGEGGKRKRKTRKHKKKRGKQTRKHKKKRTKKHKRRH